MVFAHASAGFLAAWLGERFWNKTELPRAPKIFLYGLAIFGALFPDIDLFYYYLVDASVSHRQYFTHSLIVYFLFFALVYLWAVWRKSFILKVGISLFTIGALTHLATDALGIISLWYPLDDTLVSWLQISWLEKSWLGANSTITNYILEVFFLVESAVVLGWIFIKNKIGRYLILGVGQILVILGISGLLVLNGHIFHGQNFTYYGDWDQDGLLNRNDYDADGDGQLNINDADANGNGVNNIEEMKDGVARNQGVWFDPSDGGLLEIPLRLGLVTNTDFIKRVFEQSGIFWRAEMTADYQNNPSGYESQPADEDFDRRIKNWQAWLGHQDRLQPAAPGLYQPGVIVFYGSNPEQLEKVGVVIEGAGENVIIAIVTAGKNRQLINQAELVQQIGSAQYIVDLCQNCQK